ncbi:hypothetical protein BJP36_43405 [Moorena producens JHB]|uniref:Uncharacterized protein n=1 Tax=Moorena producens (strain JHB) TaxID=1454205 RepID=A0A9Q9ST69_MOOP1|nr:hypothetical protein [Moorena producens]WAN69209.1 hypothetical protein BJP36_43405 [Moorena producens JHB]
MRYTIFFPYCLLLACLLPTPYSLLPTPYSLPLNNHDHPNP